MRARIVYVIINLEIGGSERQLFELASGLDPDRFEPMVCCLRGGGALTECFEGSGIPVKIYRFPPLDYSRKAKTLRTLTSMIRELSHYMRKKRPQIVHGILPLAFVAAGLAAELARVPLLVTSRRGLGHYKERRPLLRFLENCVNILTDAVVVNSEAVKADTLARERINPDKIRIIHNGVRIVPAPEESARRALLGAGAREPLICLTANFFPYKGHRDFLAAAAIVRKSFPSAKFVLIGDGRLRGEIEKQIEELHLSESVIILGRRPDAERIMSLCDVVVLSSYEEGFPNVVLEAMAAGRPVVATRVGGVPEAVENGVTGCLVEPRDPEGLAGAIAVLLADRERAEEMGRRGRERVRAKFSIGKMVREYEEMYEELLG